MNIRPARCALGMGAAVAMSIALMVPVASSASAATTERSQQSSQASCGPAKITGTQEQNAVGLRAADGDIWVLEVQNQYGNAVVPFGNVVLWELPAGQPPSSVTQDVDQPEALAGQNIGLPVLIPNSDGVVLAELAQQDTLAVGDPITVIYNTCDFTAAEFSIVPFGSPPTF